MPKPVCAKCGLFFRPKKNGKAIEERMPMVEVNTETKEIVREYWVPYKLWMGDLWECRGCGAEIVVGFGSAPVIEHFHPGYDKCVASYQPVVVVNDC